MLHFGADIKLRERLIKTEGYIAYLVKSVLQDILQNIIWGFLFTECLPWFSDMHQEFINQSISFAEDHRQEQKLQIQAEDCTMSHEIRQPKQCIKSKFTHRRQYHYMVIDKAFQLIDD